MRQRAGRGAGYSLSEDDRSSGNDHVHRLSRESHSQRVLAERSGFGLGWESAHPRRRTRRRLETVLDVNTHLATVLLELPPPSRNMPPASTAFAMNICQPDAGGRGYIPLADHGLSVFLPLHLPPPSVTSVFSSQLTVHPASQNRKSTYSRSRMSTNAPVRVVNGS